MDAEHQRRIVELEACQPSTPPEEREARAVQLKAATEQMEIQVTTCQTLLEKTIAMWAQMEDIPAVVDTRREIQGAQEKLTKINEEIASLTPLQKLVRLKETRHLQEDIQTLRAKEIEVLKQLQPWQDEVSDMALNIESKLMEYKNT